MTFMYTVVVWIVIVAAGVTIPIFTIMAAERIESLFARRQPKYKIDKIMFDARTEMSEVAREHQQKGHGVPGHAGVRSYRL